MCVLGDEPLPAQRALGECAVSGPALVEAGRRSGHGRGVGGAGLGAVRAVHGAMLAGISPQGREYGRLTYGLGHLN